LTTEQIQTFAAKNMAQVDESKDDMVSAQAVCIFSIKADP
jgi:hypothetical protein